MLLNEMSRTSTISSYWSVKTFFRCRPGSAWRPQNSSSYIRATRARRLAEAFAFGVLADGQEDFAHGPLDPRPVDRLGRVAFFLPLVPVV